MTEIRIRQDHENGCDIELCHAVEYVRDGRDELGDRVGRVVVTLVYTEDIDTGKCDWAKQPIVYKAGQAVFGQQVEVYARTTRYGTQHDPYITWASAGNLTVAEAKVYAEMVTLAATIAEAASK